jgi:tRNA(Arg) A34 adenosine deaminase TadA
MQAAAEFMTLAINKAKEGIRAGQSPFGAVVVKDDAVVAAAHNRVWMTCDPTAHAEMNGIREAAKTLATIDLSGCIMYTTCEPCPMCLTAIHWARVNRVVYGATIEDAAEASFNELKIPAKALVQQGGSSLIVESGLLQPECVELFRIWKDAALGGSY